MRHIRLRSVPIELPNWYLHYVYYLTSVNICNIKISLIFNNAPHPTRWAFAGLSRVSIVPKPSHPKTNNSPSGVDIDAHSTTHRNNQIWTSNYRLFPIPRYMDQHAKGGRSSACLCCVTLSHIANVHAPYRWNMMKCAFVRSLNSLDRLARCAVAVAVAKQACALVSSFIITFSCNVDEFSIRLYRTAGRPQTTYKHACTASHCTALRWKARTSSRDQTSG